MAFDPATHTDIDPGQWHRWEVKARTAAREMRDWIEATATPASPAAQHPAKPAFKDAVWGELKAIVLAAAFRKRCAFCEARVAVTGFGDAEHYRPKRAVKVQNAAGEWETLKVGSDEHPGYAWLAYDWQNLVPACTQCNNRKANQFPVAKVHCARPASGRETTPELNQYEEPLLLHPYFDAPREHLRFGDDGSVAARAQSTRGAATIRVCGLDREELTDARAEAQRLAWLEVADMIRRGRGFVDAVSEVFARCDSGELQFGAAVSDFLTQRLDQELDLRQKELAAMRALRAKQP